MNKDKKDTRQVNCVLKGNEILKFEAIRRFQMRDIEAPATSIIRFLIFKEYDRLVKEGEIIE